MYELLLERKDKSTRADLCSVPSASNTAPAEQAGSVSGQSQFTSERDF